MAYITYKLTEKTEYMTCDYLLAEKYARERHKRTSAVISIHSRSYNINPLIFCDEKNQIKDVLFLCFGDVRDEESIYGISDKDAADIADFALKWVNNVDLLIVHCDGGISRSAGVCAAIVHAYGGQYERFFDHYRMRPNMHCYHKVLAVMQKKMTERVNNSTTIKNKMAAFEQLEAIRKKYACLFNEKTELAEIDEFRFMNHMQSCFERIAEGFDAILVNRGEEENMVVMSQTIYNSLMRTAYLLGDRENVARLEKSIEQHHSGDITEQDIAEETE